MSYVFIYVFQHTYPWHDDLSFQIVIQEFSANMDRIQVVLLGVEKGNATTLTRKHNISEICTSPVSSPFYFLHAVLCPFNIIMMA